MCVCVPACVCVFKKYRKERVSLHERELTDVPL